jgi:alpha-beta hydrolase superfamily lysophospholipase
VEGARHELFIEKDEYRQPVLTRIIRFFDAHD